MGIHQSIKELLTLQQYFTLPLSLKGIKRCRSTSSENIFKIKMAWDTNCILLDAGGCLHKICNKTFTDGTFLTK